MDADLIILNEIMLIDSETDIEKLRKYVSVSKIKEKIEKSVIEISECALKNPDLDEV